MYFWTDSTIILSWIASPSTKWKTFDAHRVNDIQEKTLYTDWRYSSTKKISLISYSVDVVHRN